MLPLSKLWHVICYVRSKTQRGSSYKAIRKIHKSQAWRKRMKTQITAVKTRNVVRTDDKVDVQISKVGFAVIGLSSCAIGIWAAASLLAGMIASGGPVALVANWFRAVIG
jgi:hypothetical protein